MRFINVQRRGLSRGLTLGALALASVGCNTDKLLKVKDLAVATPEQLTTKASVPTVYYGAIGDFQAAWNGNGLTDAFVPTVGIFTDEFRSSDTFTTRNDADRRQQAAPANGNLADNSYIALHRARRTTEVGAALVTNYFTAADSRAAELTALAGYTYLAFGEAFCGNVPVPPTANADNLPPAPGISTAALFDTAIVRFNKTISTADTTVSAGRNARNLARVGLGRALLDSGNYAAAAAAVAAVPLTFVYKVASSSNTTREQNSLWNLNGSNRRYTMADTEGTNGLNFRSANDPRTIWRRFFTSTGSSVGFDGVHLVYEQRLYGTSDADTPLADGVEAKLIIAEALLNAGNATWLDTLNMLRANVGTLEAARFDDYNLNTQSDSVTNTTLAPLTDPGTQAARVDLLFRERAFWLFATGHRLGDLRRLMRQYGRAANAVFPTGQYWKNNNPYGNDVAFQISFAENNNKLYNPAACVTTQP